MKLQNHLLLCAIATFALTGCATTPLPAASAKSVPPDRHLAYRVQSIATSAIIVVTRDVGYIGSSCYNGFMINGALAARFGPGETATFHVAPGELLLKSGVDPQGKGLCGFAKEHWTQRETLVKSGERKYFRLSLSADGFPDVQRTE